MTRRATVLGMLRSFLGTLVSRNTDSDGYWLFGRVIQSLVDVDIDLTASEASDAEGGDHFGALRRASRTRFSQQLAKARIRPSLVRSARLRLVRSEVEVQVTGEDGIERRGFNVMLEATVITDAAKVVSSKRTVFVAPHDPSVERRRLPENWGLA